MCNKAITRKRGTAFMRTLQLFNIVLAELAHFEEICSNLTKAQIQPVYQDLLPVCAPSWTCLYHPNVWKPYFLLDIQSNSLDQPPDDLTGTSQPITIISYTSCG